MSLVPVYVNGTRRTSICCENKNNGIQILDHVKSKVITDVVRYREIYVQFETTTESVGSFNPDAYKPSFFNRSQKILSVNVITPNMLDARAQ